MTNSDAAALMHSIGIEVSQSIQLDYIGFSVLITIASSASFITPIGYQTNLPVHDP